MCPIDEQILIPFRVNRTTQLIRPLKSVLDDSIGCALWFASRGHGAITNHASGDTDYKSKARVVLSGLGADEQLGGYSRFVALVCIFLTSLGLLSFSFQELLCKHFSKAVYEKQIKGELQFRITFSHPYPG